MTLEEIEVSVDDCPFCKGGAMLFKSEKDKKFYVTCIDELENCNVISSTIGFDNSGSAIKAWNKRGSIILCH